MATAPSPAAAPRLVPLRPVERDTIPRIFLGGVDRFGRPDALQCKRDGQWRPLSHAEMEQRVARLAAALEEEGFAAGDRAVILSENRPEWAIADYAVTGLGGVDVPIYPTLPANQVAYILRDCAARVVFVSTRAQLDKLTQVRGELPDLRLVVAFDDPGHTPGVHTFAELLERGRAATEAGRVEPFRQRAERVARDDVATLIYTSGTTGNPKGVMLTHWNLCSNVAGVHQHDFLEPRPGDVALSFLPLSHVFERTVDYFLWDAGVGIAYAESMERVVDNLAEVRPTVAVSVPRLFEKIYGRVTGGTGLKGRIAAWAVGVGGRVVDERAAGREPGGVLRAQFALADRLVFSKLRERTGGRMRTFVSGGAPLSAEIARFFFAAGLPVYEGYGLTETSPVIAANRPAAWRLGSVGQPFAGVEVRIAEGGEILTRGPHIMKGYWNNPTATAEVIDGDGWFHTGDVGEVTPDGFLLITDRIRNLIVTAGGKNVAPAPIENLALMSPLVSQVVMIGDRRPFPILLVVPDFENLASWARTQGMDADPRVLVDDPRVEAVLERETLGRLHGFAKYELPKKVLVLPEEFTVDAGTLTPTLKVRRKAVESLYAERIEALYAAGRGSE